MRAGWNEADPPALPAPRLRDRARLVLRAALAALLTAVLFATFLLARTAVPRRAPAIVRLWARLALPLVGLRYRRVGEPMAGPGAILANHASWLDILVLSRAGPVVFVSKSEVAGWPVIGQIGRAIGTVFIERRAQASLRQTELLRARIRDGDRLCVFPEGTSTDGRRVLAFNSTLFDIFFEAGRPLPVRVQPVSILYRAPSGLPASFYGWWGDMDFAAHLASVLALSSGGEVTVRFGMPLEVARFADRKQLCRAARAEVAAGFEALLAAEVPSADRGLDARA